MNFKVESEGKMVEIKEVKKIVERKDKIGKKVKIGDIGVEKKEDVGNLRSIEYGKIEQVGKEVIEKGNIIGRKGELLKSLEVGREEK